MAVSVLNLQLLLKGRPLRDYSFFQEAVRIGRDPQNEVQLDNMAVSREQAQIVASKDGWVLQDCGSANGTWLNGRKVERAFLRDRDEIVIGKFTLRVGLESGVKVAPGLHGRRPGPDGSFDGTTVLTRGQLAAILDPEAESADGVPSLALVAPEAGSRTRRRTWLIVGALLLAAAGMAAVIFLR